MILQVTVPNTVTLDRTLGGLGISITGGADNQILDGNSGVFITNVSNVSLLTVLESTVREIREPPSVLSNNFGSGLA